MTMCVVVPRKQENLNFFAENLDTLNFVPREQGYPNAHALLICVAFFENKITVVVVSENRIALRASPGR